VANSSETAFLEINGWGKRRLPRNACLSKGRKKKARRSGGKAPLAQNDWANRASRNSPNFAVALNCGIGSSALNAEVNAFEDSTRFTARISRSPVADPLVIFSAARVTALQEVTWYVLYRTALWVIVAIVVKKLGRGLVQRSV